MLAKTAADVNTAFAAAAGNRTSYKGWSQEGLRRDSLASATPSVRTHTVREQPAFLMQLPGGPSRVEREQAAHRRLALAVGCSFRQRGTPSLAELH